MAIENSVSIIGRLTADPELRQTQTGTAVCSVRIAVRRPYADDKTDFFAVNVWSEKAKYLCRYGYKGGRVAVCGYLTEREYDDRNGVTRHVTEISCTEVQCIDFRKTEQPPCGAPVQKPEAKYIDTTAGEPLYDLSEEDDLPF